MPKFIIYWNAGYGDMSEIIECDRITEAREAARAAWLTNPERRAQHERK